MRAKDLTGQVFGRLLVKEYAGQHIYPSGKPRRQWLCVCLNDGNELIVNGNDLLNGHTKSCGCLNDEKRSERRFIDLAGETINGFEVIKRVGTEEKNAKWKTSTPIYLVQCLNCGRFIEMRADYLRSGDVHSCGCLVKKREAEIEDYLEFNRIDYAKGVSFVNLINDVGGQMFIDFAIFGDDGILRCVLEEQGVHHDSTAVKLQDDIKKKYCKEHNIPFVELWYDEDISDAMNEIVQKYLHANPVPSIFDEGETTISKESTCLMKFQHGSAVPLRSAG